MRIQSRGPFFGHLGASMNADILPIDPEVIIERLEPGLSPGARILRRQYGINGYRTDRSGLEGQLPLFVLQPREPYDVQALCKLVSSLCDENGGEPPVVIVPRGGGTGQCGGAVPLQPSIVLDMSYMDRYMRVNDDLDYYYVQPGMTIGRLNDEIGGYSRFFPAIPVGAADEATVGGVISTNATGMYAAKYGRAADSVARLDVVLADGIFVQLGPHAIESASGVNLAPLMIGAEGTLGIIVGAVVRLSPAPHAIKSLYLILDDPYFAFFACDVVRNAGPEIATVQLLSVQTVNMLARAKPDAGLPKNKAMLWVEFHSDKYDPDEIDTSCTDELRDEYYNPIYREWTPPDGVNPWALLRDLPNVVAGRSDDGVVVSFSPAVPVGRLGDYIRDDIQKWLAEKGRPGSTSIVCDGGIGICRIHLAIGKGRRWSMSAATEFREFALQQAVRWGGTASGMYGVGSMMIPNQVTEKPRGINVLRQIKKLLDPKGILNPGKLVDWPAAGASTNG